MAAPQLEGTAATDHLTGTVDDEFLRGNAGDGTLDGAGGADRLEGGLGNDTYIIDRFDFLTERAGEGTDLVVSAVNFGLGAYLDNLKVCIR